MTGKLYDSIVANALIQISESSRPARISKVLCSAYSEAHVASSYHILRSLEPGDYPPLHVYDPVSDSRADQLHDIRSLGLNALSCGLVSLRIAITAKLFSELPSCKAIQTIQRLHTSSHLCVATAVADAVLDDPVVNQHCAHLALRRTRVARGNSAVDDSKVIAAELLG
jgi:hypothetical protein